MSDEVIIRHRGIADNPTEAQRLAVQSYSLTDWLCASADRYAILSVSIILATILCPSCLCVNKL
ncbi:MAG: hypothetical protein K2K97_09115 [Muribaculaceae bacterium]|nr:hypothetical protein [Muribaculaceae bacterium]